MMKPYFESEYARLYLGNCLDTLAALPDQSVHCVVTSPPYFGLRDYGTGTWEGGDPACDHVGTIKRSVSGGPGKQQSNKGSNEVYSGPCRCGAVRVDPQIGLEPTPEAFVEALVEVFSQVYRVLRDDGTLWLNIGDTFWGSWGNSGNRPELTGKAASQRERNVERHSRPAYDERRDRPATSRKRDDIKPKELIGIPWMLAFALRRAGIYSRIVMARQRDRKVKRNNADESRALPG